MQVPLIVTQRLKVSNGVNGLRHIQYRYGGLRSHIDYGSLGFNWQETETVQPYHSDDFFVTNSLSQIDYAVYRQDFPLTGQIEKTQSQQCLHADHRWEIGVETTCHVVSQEISDWSVVETGTTPDRKVYRPQITKTTEHTWDPSL